MTTVNLTCVICTENYKNSDSIISTSCGHVFHSNCLNEWRMRSTGCPQCRASVAMTYRLYLNFEEGSSEKEIQITELKSKIEQHIQQSSILQQQLDQSERDFLKLEEQFTKKDGKMQELYKKIEYLELQNATRVNEIELKTIEIHKLQETLNSANPQASTVMLQEEIKILKEKNKQIANELNKEIRNNTQLSVDKMKLENMLEFTKSQITQTPSTPAPTPPTAAPEISATATKSTPTPSSRISSSQSKCETPCKAEKTRAKRPERPDSSQSHHFQTNRGCVQSVVIKHVRGTFADEAALKSYVFKLSDMMDLFYSGDDLQQVTVMERKQQDSMSLIAKFKSIPLKAQFLSRKERLKLNEDTKNLLVYEYVGDNTNSLFHYAKTLKPLGFKHVYCRNNIVYVKKEDGGLAVRIKCREDVDRLKGETQRPNTAADRVLSVDELPLTPRSGYASTNDTVIDRIIADCMRLV